MPSHIAPGTSVKSKPVKISKGFYGGGVVLPAPTPQPSNVAPSNAKGQGVFSALADVFDDESTSGPAKKQPLSKPPTPMEDSSKVLKGILKSSGSLAETLDLDRAKADLPTSTDSAEDVKDSSGGNSFENSFLSFISKDHDESGGSGRTSSGGGSHGSGGDILSPLFIENIEDIASPEDFQDRFNVSSGPIKEISLHEAPKPPASPADTASLPSRTATPIIPTGLMGDDIDEMDDDDEDQMVIDCGAIKTPPSGGALLKTPPSDAKKIEPRSHDPKGAVVDSLNKTINITKDFMDENFMC